MINRSEKVANYTRVDNRVIYDKRLSADARAVMLWILAHPDDWHPTQKKAMAEFGFKQTVATRIWTELRTCGYFVQYRESMPGGQVKTVTDVHEVPVDTPVPLILGRGQDSLGSVDAPTPEKQDTATVSGFPDTRLTPEQKALLTTKKETKDEVSPPAVWEVYFDRFCQRTLEEHSVKVGNSKKQRDAMRLLVEKDSNPDEVAAVVRYIMDPNCWWYGAILSPDALRKKFAQLRVAMKRDQKNNKGESLTKRFNDTSDEPSPEVLAKAPPPTLPPT